MLQNRGWAVSAWVWMMAVGAVAVTPEQWQKVLEQNQYKRFHVAILETGLEGDWTQALAQANESEARLADDPETALLHAAIHTHLGQPDKALSWCATALARGLEVGRLAAEAHNLLAGLPGLEDLTREVALVHGPMLGNVTSSSASIWVRTSHGMPVEVRAYSREGVEVARAAGQTREDADCTAVLVLDGLAHATAYRYGLQAGGQTLTNEAWHFTTADPSAPRVRIAFGGGAGYTPENERMWDTVASVEPEVLLLLGDNVYIDNPTHREIQRYCYYRRQSRPEFRRLVCHVPVYAVWDDHDFGTNDCWYGTNPDEPGWKRDVLEVFRQNWVNPSYGGGDAVPGVWFSFTYGPAEFVMTDGRYYRSDPAATPRTMLGSAQKGWLLDRIRGTRQPFTVLASGVPWAPGTKGESKDTWDGYPEERDEILSALDGRGLKHVLLLSADRHRSDLWKIARPGGHEYIEFESSRLTNQHVHETMPAALFSYNEKQSFGLIEFDASTDTPTMRLTVMSIDGERVFSMEK